MCCFDYEAARQTPDIILQDLCDEAESVRQQEVTKSLMKTQLWQKLEKRIKEKPQLQTSEMMPGSGVAKSQKEKDTGDWETDDITQYIRSQTPGATSREVQAECFVEVELVPRFRDGAFAAAGVDSYPSNTWPPEAQGSVSVCSAW